MTPVVFEGVVEYSAEDGGQALIATLHDQVEPAIGPDEDGMFVRLQSWDEGLRHELARSLEGRRVRVTVEVLESGGEGEGR